jgi:cytochrome b subunit of formate dehydrogenase
MVGGLIIHVLLVFLFPGTLAGMTNGRVTRAWAAWHHPRWFRESSRGEVDGPERPAAGATEPAEPTP